MKIPCLLLLALLCCLTGCGREEPPPVTTLPMEAPAAETSPPPRSGFPLDTDFVLLSAYMPGIHADLRYAAVNNFTGQQVYSFSQPYLRCGTARKLAAVQTELEEQGLSLKIWDAFRPVSAQYQLWEAYPDAAYVADPNSTYSAHSRGNTVDLTLVDASGQELEMPSDYDEFSALADRNYSDCSREAAKNAQLLQSLMEKHGFTGYSKEWWHFTDTDSYPVEKIFDPALVGPWYVFGSAYSILHTQPDVESPALTTIPQWDTVTLMGYTKYFALVEYRGWQGYVLKECLSQTNALG